MSGVQQFLARAALSGAGDVAFDSAMGATQSAASGSAMDATLAAAASSGRESVLAIGSDPSSFLCGALRTGIERTPIFGPVFRLGEAALGKRMCEKEEMSAQERKSLARGAAVDLVIPNASFVLDAAEMGASKEIRPLLEKASPGITQSPSYQAYASALGPSDEAPQAPSLDAIGDKLAARRAAKAQAQLALDEPERPAARM